MTAARSAISGFFPRTSYARLNKSSSSCAPIVSAFAFVRARTSASGISLPSLSAFAPVVVRTFFCVSASSGTNGISFAAFSCANLVSDPSVAGGVGAFVPLPKASLKASIASGCVSISVGKPCFSTRSSKKLYRASPRFLLSSASFSASIPT